MSEREEEGDWFEDAVESSGDPADSDEADLPDEEWEDSWEETPEDRSADTDTDTIGQEGESTESEGGDTEEPDTGDGDADRGGDDGRTDAGGFGDLGDGAAATDDDAEEIDTSNADADGFGDLGSDDPAKADEEQDDSDANLFEDDFAAALSDTDVPTPDSDAGGDTGGSAGDEFSMTGSGGGMDPSGGAFDMGTDDLGSLDGLGGDEGFDADQEDLDSEIDRIKLGVEGLDAMIQGGIPERTLMVAIGSPGTGKTTLGLHFLEEGLEQGEKAVYITLEETRERVIRSATEKNMPFDEYHEEGQLAVIDIDPVEMANSLQTIRSELPRLIDEFGASRLVLDSVSLLEMMYEDRATRRNEIYDFTKSLKASGVTTLMTSEASEDSAYTSRHRIVEYLTDAVFILQYVRPSDFRETRLAIEIQKIRDAHHSRETKPYEITNEGMSVYRQANIF